MPRDDRDDETQATGVDGETQAFDPIDEPTRVMRPDDQPTRVMRPDDAATRVLPGGDDATRRVSARRHGRDGMEPAPATERIMLPERRPVGTWLIAAVVVVALLTGAAVGYTQARPSDNNVVARALVGPDGGVMTFDGKGALTVPKGALPAPTAITVRKDAIGQRVRLGAESDPRSVTYEPGELVVYAFEPSDLRFQQPVTIELPRNGNGSAVFVDVRGSPRVIPAEASGDTVKIETTSFTFDSTSAAAEARGRA